MPIQLENYYNRFDPAKGYDAVLIRDGFAGQGAKINEIQSGSGRPTPSSSIASKPLLIHCFVTEIPSVTGAFQYGVEHLDQHQLPAKHSANSEPSICPARCAVCPLQPSRFRWSEQLLWACICGNE